MRPTSLVPALGAVLLLAPAVPAAAGTGPAARPRYVCESDGPVPRIFPPMVHGRSCTPYNGAVREGRTRGPVTIVITESLYSGASETWRCKITDSLDDAEEPPTVWGQDCSPGPS